MAGLSALAGLALHQGNIDQLTVGDETILIGTALDAQIETNSPEDNSSPVELSGQDRCVSETSAQNEEVAEDCERDIADESLPHELLEHQAG